MARSITETRIVVLRVTDAGDRAVYTARVTPDTVDALTERAQARVDAIVAAGGQARIDGFTHTVSA